jgi:site-specific recombinase XerD
MGQFRPGRFPTPCAAPASTCPKEVEHLIAAARQNRYRHRDATMILIAYRHGLRVSELCALRWNQVNFEHGPAGGGAITGPEQRSSLTVVRKKSQARAAQPQPPAPNRLDRPAQDHRGCLCGVISVG